MTHSFNGFSSRMWWGTATGAWCLQTRVFPEVGLSSDSAEGWVKVNDVLTSDYFKDMTRDILMKVRPARQKMLTAC